MVRKVFAMDFPVIYILTNKQNGKSYIGLARKSFASRLNSHFKNDSYIGKALRKYGLDGFDIQQLAYRKEELNYWEKYFIAKLNTRHPGGYNLTDGGDGLVNPVQEVRDRIAKKVKELERPPDFTFEGHTHSQETRDKISIILRNSEKKKQSDMQKRGKKLPPVSLETREKIRKIKTGKPRTDAQLFSERMKEFASQPGYVNPMAGKKRPDLAERNRARRGLKASEETRIKQSTQRRGVPKSPHHALAMRIGNAISRFARAIILQ
jgi:group I intron endonuclease